MDSCLYFVVPDQRLEGPSVDCASKVSEKGNTLLHVRVESFSKVLRRRKASFTLGTDGVIFLDVNFTFDVVSALLTSTSP